MGKRGSRGTGDLPPSGDTTPLPVPDRTPDPLVDGTARDGTQPADRGHVDIPPDGGR